MILGVSDPRNEICIRFQIPKALPSYQKKGETGMLYYTIEIDDKTWEMLEKICKIKNLTPDQLIKRGIEKVVEKEYLNTV